MSQHTPELPKALYSDTLRILGVDLVVYVLDNGQRVVDMDSVHQLFEAMGNTDAPLTEDDAVALAKVIRGVK